MIAEALRALYDLAPKCDVCEEHRATREPATRVACRWRVCDRDACEARCLCADCGRDGYADADDYRRANDIAHPTAQVVDARDLPRLPRRGGR